MQYLDFDLEIGAGTGRSYPIVVRSAAGDTRQMMQFPYDNLALKDTLKDLRIALLQSSQTHRVLTDEEQAVQEFGLRLFEALFAGVAGSLFYESRSKAVQEGRPGVRVRLNVLAPELAGLPWEYLYDPRSSEYLSLSRSTPVVRYPELATPLQPLEVGPPLRILGMIASPKDQEPLDIKREKARMEEALKTLTSSGLVELSWLEGQTWEDLQEALWPSRGPWHIFHFIGHGGFDQRAGEGVLAFCDEEGQTRLLGARNLALLLTSHSALRLVVLNACEGAKGGLGNIFSSTAAALARRGIPAVLAMQEAITDKAAIQLTRTFYRALANGLSVDAAVAEARTAISVSLRHSLEWGTPVLFLRAPNSILFTLSGAPTPPVVQAPDPPEPIQAESAKVEPAMPVALTVQQEAPTLPHAVPMKETPPSPPPKTKEQWVEEGEQHGAAGRYQEALKCYKQATKIDPTYILAIRGKSIALFNLKQYKEALEAAEEAIRHAPGDVAAYNSKGNALKELRRYEEALEAFNRAIALDFSQADFFLGKGETLNALKRYEEALADFDHALQLHENDLLILLGKGEAFLGLKRYSEALAISLQTIQIDPAYGPAYLIRAEALIDLQRTDEAIGACDDAIRLNPTSARAYADRGRLLSLNRRYQDALAAYTQAQQLDPYNPNAHAGQGQVFVALGWHEEALVACERAIKLAPDCIPALRTKAQALVSLKRLNEAVPAYQQVIPLAPFDIELYKSLGLLLTELKRYEDVWVVREQLERLPLTDASSQKDIRAVIKLLKLPLGAVLVTYRDREDAVLSVAWSPNGDRLASANYHGWMQVWDVKSGKNLLTCSGDNYNAYSAMVAWSPNGKYLALCSHNSAVRIWEADTGKLLLKVSPRATSSTPLRAVVWSPDGTQLASVDGSSGYVWEALTGKLLFSFSFGGNRVAWSADGKRLVSAGYDASFYEHDIRVRNATNGEVVTTYTGHTKTVTSVVWSPDGTRLASASEDKTVRVWNVASGKQLGVYTHHSDKVNAVAWSPDGKRLASGSDDGQVHVLDATSGKVLFICDHRYQVTAVAWAPDGSRLASGSWHGTVCVWLAGEE